jgi:hypothetical protein
MALEKSTLRMRVSVTEVTPHSMSTRPSATALTRLACETGHDPRAQIDGVACRLAATGLERERYGSLAVPDDDLPGRCNSLERRRACGRAERCAACEGQGEGRKHPGPENLRESIKHVWESIRRRGANGTRFRPVRSDRQPTSSDS